MKNVRRISAVGCAAVAACVAFTPTWEGTDFVAKRDRIGTGHPITYCNGLTSHDGSVKVGQRFTKAQCDAALAAALPIYWAEIEPCIKVPLSGKTAGSLLDGSFNAGPGAICRSPMLALMNAGKIRAGCNAFKGWYVRSDGVVRPGLEDRRAGELYGDKRKSERALCLEGLLQKPTRTNAADAIKVGSKSINAWFHNTPSVAREVEEPAAPPAKVAAPWYSKFLSWDWWAAE